jgi:Matrixin
MQLFRSDYALLALRNTTCLFVAMALHYATCAPAVASNSRTIFSSAGTIAAGSTESPRVIDPKIDVHEPDYLREIEVRRWPDTKLPLKVYITITGDRGFDDKLCALIHKAFRQWVTTQSSLDFEYVYEYGKADIVVERAGMGEMLDGSAGKTHYDVDMTSHALKRPVTRVRVNLYCPSGRGYDLDAEATDIFYGLALHEAGHAFGLDGHSSDPDDIMFVKSTNLKLSRRDLASIVHLYPKQ